MSKSSAYYQPEVKQLSDLTDKNGVHHFSFEVWRSKTTCSKLFPGKKVLTYHGDDIAEPTYAD